MAADAQRAFENLQSHQYLSLTTFRRNGTPVTTPVWFAQSGDKLYVFSFAGAGKIKRLRHTNRVTVAPCTIGGELLGEPQNATARILPENEAESALNALNKKYGWVKRVYDWGMDLMSAVSRRPHSKRLYIEITSA